MNKVYIQSDHIIHSLGCSTESVFSTLVSGHSGLQPDVFSWPQVEPFVTSVIDDKFCLDNLRQQNSDFNKLSRFNQLAIYSVIEASRNIDIDFASPKTLFILSTTKGDIDLLSKGDNDVQQELYLWHSAQTICRYFGNNGSPIIISNACISGLSAQVVAMRYLKSEQYTHVVLIGADLITKFVVSGFQSFKALSHTRCKPFDKTRDGLNIGEAVATLILTVGDETEYAGQVSIEKAVITNDANHISGPSRTGEGLFQAIEKVMRGASAENLSFINAHGTATLYNDEMEAIAFERSGLLQVPVNSFKGYFGHTLGAAGVIETIISAQCLSHQLILPSLGFEELGVTPQLMIAQQMMKSSHTECLKTASGFGGCNAAIRLKIN